MTTEPDLASVLVKCFNEARPCFPLAVVDLCQIKHVPIKYSPVGAAALFRNASVAVLFTVFVSPMTIQIHDGESIYAPSCCLI